MNDSPDDEAIELDETSFIRLEYGREWPDYVLSWSLRRRQGDTDFPTASGTERARTNRDEGEEDVWPALREKGIDAARRSIDSRPPKRSWFKTLLGR